MSVSSVKRAIQDLEDRGHFRVIRGAGRTENHYIAMLATKPGIPKLTVIKGSKLTPQGVNW